jgi:hypothetical protein
VHIRRLFFRQAPIFRQNGAGRPRRARDAAYAQAGPGRTTALIRAAWLIQFPGEVSELHRRLDGESVRRAGCFRVGTCPWDAPDPPENPDPPEL